MGKQVLVVYGSPRADKGQGGLESGQHNTCLLHIHWCPDGQSIMTWRTIRWVLVDSVKLTSQHG